MQQEANSFSSRSCPEQRIEDDDAKIAVGDVSASVFASKLLRHLSATVH